MNIDSNSRTKIIDLTEKNGIEDNNLLIVEDNDDTKKSTVHELKKSFLGDPYKPDNFKFYSSKKVQELFNSLSIAINNKASASEISKIKESISSVIANNGNGDKDSELVAARNGKPTLSDRLDSDREISDTKYMSKLKKSSTGKNLYIEGEGLIDISIIESEDDTIPIGTGLTIHSKNLYDPSKLIEWESHQVASVIDSSVHKYEDTGIDYFINGNNKTGGLIEMPLPTIYHGGEYCFIASIFLDIVSQADIESIKKKALLCVHYTDGRIDSIPYPFTENGEVEFKAITAFNKLSINLNTISFGYRADVQFRNVMLVKKDFFKNSNNYIPYYKKNIQDLNIGSGIYEFYNNDYIYECNVRNGELLISHYDDSITSDYIYEELLHLRKIIDNKTDKCGMITDYGTYQYLDNMYVNTYEDGVIIKDDYEYSRNGIPSKKITIAKNATRNSIIRIPLDKQIDIIETVGLFFYMDKTDYALFAANTGGLKIRLCSDNVQYSSTTNYYEYTIGKKEMVQGWNFIKKRITDFISIGNPNPNSIKYIYFEICRTDEMNGRSVYLNSFVFNQKMKPTIMLCLNGTYDESTSFLYPYLQTRNIKATLFLNSKRTLAPEIIDSILKCKIKYGWDIGLDGCHPNKEILIGDDNYRNQYTALLNSKEWLKNNIVSSPLSFSASFGNLRPITVPILKDMGFKMAKTDALGYCGFFSDKDFALPSHLISNECTAESIEDKIDYAIESNQALILYTNNVTEYGSDIDAKRDIFKYIIEEVILKRIEEGKIECLTFSEFYNRCINCI